MLSSKVLPAALLLVPLCLSFGTQASTNQVPVCIIDIPAVVQCQGNVTVVTLDGTASFDPDGQPLRYKWTACPGTYIDDPFVATTFAVIDTSQSCDRGCGIRLIVSDGPDFAICRAKLEIVDPADCCANGDPQVLVMRYTGADCSATAHSQDPDKVNCAGDPMGAGMVHIIASSSAGGGGSVWFDGFVALDQEFAIDATNAGASKLTNATFVTILDQDDNVLQEVEFHTSCSQPLRTGDTFGSLVLTDCVGENGVPDPNDCCADGDIGIVEMQYTGLDCSASSHLQEGAVDCSGDPAGASPVRIIASESSNGGGHVWFDGIVAVGKTFAADAANAGQSKLKSNTHLTILDLNDNVLQTVKFHTSCSKPLFIGDVFGSAVVTGCSPSAALIDDSCDDGDPQLLIMQYTGEDCSATQTFQDPDKVECDGDPASATPVHIIASSAAGGGGTVWFDGEVDLGGFFFIDATSAGQNKLTNETHITILSPTGDLLQAIEFHTSCSQPLVVGDQYGAAGLEAFIPE